MKNNNIIVLLLLFTILLGGCFKGSGTISISGNSEKADERLEQILDIVQDKDREALSKVFSTKATDANDNFEEDATSLFDFFQGDVVSWTQDRYTFKAVKDDGETSVELFSWYMVETDKESYMFFVIDYTIDTINPDNEGLYTLRVIKAEDEETEFGYVEDMTIPGIYIPKE